MSFRLAEMCSQRLGYLVPTSRQIVALAAPIAGVQYAQVALTTTDLAVMGLIGVQAIAAGGLAAALYDMMRTTCVGAVTAVGNLVATAAGQGEARSENDEPDAQARAEIRQITRSGLLVATAVAVLLGAALIGLGYLLPLVRADEKTLALARPMMITIAPGLIPMVWLNVLRQFAVGMRRPGSLLAVSVVSIAVNAALDLAFVRGYVGLPRIGLAGIGLATTLVQFMTVAVFYLVLRRDNHLAPLLAIDAWNADAATARRILRLGIPISLTYGSEAGFISLGAVVMGIFGPITLAAHNVVFQLTRIAFQVSIGLSHASSILTSRAIGKGDTKRLRQIAAAALLLGVLTTVLVGLSYLAAPYWVLRPFLDPDAESATVSLARTFLLFAIAFQILEFTQNISIGLLRGIGNSAAGLRASTIGYWLIGLSVMLVLAFPAHLRGSGIWIGLCVGIGGTAAVLLHKFYRSLPRTA
ncbi:MATE family efflux transporter (plasmid) [Mycobacterium intracellulare subsp. chimaera]|uniref:MATE family efflux transporter n=1 Tax=Mycobacterium intracellulare TaxID=1767 RepID=UPI000B58049A|nr:MATE family efflux transporter [Mycobacterium intracellulare]ARV85380.1 MATE family efflux transporter [Mycobacterium intracellulare subsp. chimaera]ASL24310.1 Na(+)/drug antiporter [Mycobacterium intracellulare subsp. chimaera]UCN07165.1 MATE family efflux transporter [Mycobacterium intracellulare subsp. chimaera]